MTDDTQLPEAPDGTDTSLVERVRAGDPDAFGVLYDRWFDRLHDLAYRILYDTDAAADVAQDAFISAWRNIGTLDDPSAFGGWILRIARNRALNHQRKHDRSRPADDERLAMIEQAQTRPEDRIGTLDDPARVAEDTELAGLLWSAADALGERDRDVLDLHLRHGLAPAEIADVVGLNRNAANQLVHRVRQRLAVAVGARVLWRGGMPACAALRAALEAAEVDGFDADAVRVAERHTAACAECTDRQRTHLSPAQMFSAVPFLVIPSLKAKVAHALAAEGVPMQGSASLRTPRRPRRGRVRRALIATGAATAVVASVIAVGATRAHDGELLVDELTAEHEQVTTTTAPRSTTTAPPSTTTSTTGPTTTTTHRIVVVPPVVPPPVVPPPVAPTTTTTPPTTILPLAPVLTLDIVPNVAPTSYPMGPGAPRLTWSAQNSPGAIVSGPANFRSTEVAGSALVCPAVLISPSFCTAQPGDYVYTLEARDSTGKLLDKIDVTLKIG